MVAIFDQSIPVMRGDKVTVTRGSYAPVQGYATDMQTETKNPSVSIIVRELGRESYQIATIMRSNIRIEEKCLYCLACGEPFYAADDHCGNCGTALRRVDSAADRVDLFTGDHRSGKYYAQRVSRGNGGAYRVTGPRGEWALIRVIDKDGHASSQLMVVNMNGRVTSIAGCQRFDDAQGVLRPLDFDVRVTYASDSR